MNRKKWALLALVIGAIALFFALDAGHYFDLAYFKAHQARLEAFRAEHPLQLATLFFLVYVAVTGLSLPGAALMTLVAGALFGLAWGTLLVSFASSLGATLAFLVSRFLLRDLIQQRFSRQLTAINRGVEKEGHLYLFTLRLVPLFPFFVINLAMGLTTIRTWTFYWISQVGMLAGTLVYVNAGTQIARIDSLGGILSPPLLLSFTLLGLFPLLAARISDTLRRRRLYRDWPRPQRFDSNLVVIGAGSAGLVTAYIGAAVKARVTLIEKHRMGGDCLNTGCVPSKALIRSTRFIAQCRRAESLGMERAEVDFRFATIMERVQRVIRQVEPHDSIERYTGLGVECVQGRAQILSPFEVEVEGRRIRTRNIVIATGARPALPAIEGLSEVDPLTSDTIWALRELPPRLLIIGAGPIACELAQCFARLGSQVTLALRGERLLVREDPEVSALVEARFISEGIAIRRGFRMQRFVASPEYALVGEQDGAPCTLPFDRVLVATGRQPNTQGFGLERLGLSCRKGGSLEVNAYLQTRFPNIYACGDVAGPYQFTHAAAHQAWYAAVNALFGGIKRFKVDYSVIPAATFIEPEVARVGLNEQEARAQQVPYEVTRFDLGELDRAIADGETAGFVKVLTEPGRDRILGATIVGEQAGELISEYVTAMRHGLGLNKLLATIHIYPTLMEANKYAAGTWKRAHAPERLLRWVARYQRWLRGQPGGAEGNPGRTQER